MPGVDDGDRRLQIDLTRTVDRFDRRLLGTNVPAWLGPDLLADPSFRELTTALGTTMIRMPGGSWSNYYDWSACEEGRPCPFERASRPRDFANLVESTGAAGMWTVNVNGTVQEAAALVAYFNGEVGDELVIGIDRNGRDWGTVSDSAQRRVDAGLPDPVPIMFWEVGNEVYGSRAGVGCADWGWEDIWTCDGKEYVEGIDGHDGYLAFRDAMREVDPDIVVGAVGVEEQGSWGNWGNEVLTAAGDSLDFSSIHQYPYLTEPDVDDVAGRPAQIWPTVMDGWSRAVTGAGLSLAPPVAVTEYNIVASQEHDPDAFMVKGVSALFVAESIGQMASAGVAMATHWNLANGRAENGTDYGMIDVRDHHRNPQYYGLAMWNEFGEHMLAMRDSDPTDALTAYAARSASGLVTVLAVNQASEPIEVTIELDGADGSWSAVVDELEIVSLTDVDVRFNGSTNPNVQLTEPPARQLGQVSSTFGHTVPPLSVSLLRLEPS